MKHAKLGTLEGKYKNHRLKLTMNVDGLERSIGTRSTVVLLLRQERLPVLIVKRRQG